MTYFVLLHPKAAKYLSMLSETLQARIKNALRELENSADMKGERLAVSSFWRIRVGDYRAIYEIDMRAKRVVVLYIGHRSTVYDDFRRML